MFVITNNLKLGNQKAKYGQVKEGKKPAANLELYIYMIHARHG